jgi:sugar lactone lactonase YvrE
VWDAVPVLGGAAQILEISAVDTATGRRAPGDLWVSERRGSEWSDPRPLGAGVNSGGTENFIFLSPDGRELFYVRNFDEVRHISLAAALAAPPDSARAPRRLATVTGLSIPESARRDGNLDLVFVSNISGGGQAKDNDGFISRLLPDGTIDSLRFIAGGRGGVTLHAPRGMAIRRDTLWVADLDAVRAFSTRTGAPLATVDLAPLGALFLNDVAVGPDGTVYVTDTGFGTDSAGRPTHTGPDRIFRIAGGTPAVALETPRLNRPNGITWDPASRRFLIAPLGDSTIVAWTPGDSTLTPVAKGPGSFDGIEVRLEGFIVSSLTGSVSLVRNGVFHPVITGITRPADIGWDPTRSRLYIPQLGENRLEIWELP